MSLKQVERGPVSKEISFVIEQRFDDPLRQIRLFAHDQDGDELIERSDFALTHQRRNQGLQSFRVIR